MPTYLVTLPVSAFLYLNIIAQSEADAIEKAKEKALERIDDSTDMHIASDAKAKVELISESSATFKLEEDADEDATSLAELMNELDEDFSHEDKVTINSLEVGASTHVVTEGHGTITVFRVS